MALARRCDVGCETWPDDPQFKRCPLCGGKTERFSNGEPLEMDEALKIKRQQEFEAYYAIHCRNLGQPVDGDLPAGPDEARFDDLTPEQPPPKAAA